MRHWLFILIEGVGVCLLLGAIVMLTLGPDIDPPYANRVHGVESVAALAGTVMAVWGFFAAKRAGELTIRDEYYRSRRDHQVAGTEIAFSCPSCNKAYRASPLLAGKPFVCRDCQTRFNVPLATPALPMRSA